MPWWKGDDGWHDHPKLQAVGRAGRGLLSDMLSYSSRHKTDGFIATTSLSKVDASLTDPDFKKLVKAKLLHRRGDTCKCIDKRDWEWPAERGHLIHDFLDYNPSREENDVAKVQRAELRDPSLRAAVRARDFGICRYCVNETNAKDRRGDMGETLDHVDPAIANGEENLVIACRGCNSAKKKRTPAEALMTLHTIAEARAKHFANLGLPDPDLAQNLEPTQVAQADGPGRDGSGSGRVGHRSQVGPASTRRDSVSLNPYLRAGHGDPSRDPPPPQPDPPPEPPVPSPIRRSQRPQKQTRKRRRR